MDKTIYIHIGGLKTGTTAIQLFFANHRNELAAQGFCYPGTAGAHWSACRAEAGESFEDRQAYAVRTIRRYVDEIEASSCHTGIISAECLSRRGEAATLREHIPPSVRVRIVYYARRQDSLMESFFSEAVKSRHFREGDPLDEEYVRSAYSDAIYDHIRVLAPWAAAFGKENIIVRCYETRQLNGDSVTDFAQVAGLRLGGSLMPSKERIKESLDRPHLEFIRLCNKAFPESLEILHYIFSNGFQHSRVFHHLKKQRLLSPKTRIAILEYYEESNRAIAREYLMRSDGRLFHDPWPDPDEPWEPYMGLSFNDLTPIINEMFQNFDHRQREQEPLVTILSRVNRAARIAVMIIPLSVRKALAKRADQLNR